MGVTVIPADCLPPCRDGPTPWHFANLIMNGVAIAMHPALAATLAAGGDKVNMNATDVTNRTVISYIDKDVMDPDLEYTVQSVTGNGDMLLEQGELMTVTIDFTTQVAGPVYNVGTNQTFILEIKPPTGSYLVIQRTTPPSLNQPIIDLY